MTPDRSSSQPSGDLSMLDALVQVSFSVQDLLARVAARYDLSVTQARMLGILRDREPAMSDLREHLGLEKSSVSGLIDRAELRGLVARTTGHPDGRAVRVRLTPGGADLSTRFAGEVYAELGRLLAPLSERDQRQFGRLAGVIVATQASPFAQPRSSVSATSAS